MATPHIADLIALAIRLVNANQRDRARIVCEQAVAAYPPHPAVHQLLAVLDMQAGQPAAAGAHAALSLKLRPDHGPTLLVLGDAALAQRDLAAAAQALERAVVLAPDQAEAWFKVSLVRQDLRDLDGAAQALERVLALNPQRADALVNLGIVLQEAGRLDDALHAYGRAYRLREDTFGRIAHALSTPNVGRLWLDLDGLRAELTASCRLGSALAAKTLSVHPGSAHDPLGHGVVVGPVRLRHRLEDELRRVARHDAALGDRHAGGQHAAVLLGRATPPGS